MIEQIWIRRYCDKCDKETIHCIFASGVSEERVEKYQCSECFEVTIV